MAQHLDNSIFLGHRVHLKITQAKHGTERMEITKRTGEKGKTINNTKRVRHCAYFAQQSGQPRTKNKLENTGIKPGGTTKIQNSKFTGRQKI